MTRPECVWVRALDVFMVTVPREPLTTTDVELLAASIKQSLIRRDVVLGREERPTTRRRAKTNE